MADVTTPPSGGQQWIPDEKSIEEVKAGAELCKQSYDKVKPGFSNEEDSDYRRKMKTGLQLRLYIITGAGYIGRYAIYLSGVITAVTVNLLFNLWVEYDKFITFLDAFRNELRKSWYTLGERLYKIIRNYEKNAMDAGRNGDATALAIGKDLAEKRSASSHGRRGPKPVSIPTQTDGSSTQTNEQPH
jgi:hypothetical protein